MWDMIWQWGLGIGLIILCLVLAYFSPLYKKDFIWAAAIIIMALLFEGIGIAQEKSHCVAQQQVIVDTVTKVVHSTTTPKSQQQKDKYDEPNN
jgi:hypothetical protein